MVLRGAEGNGRPRGGGGAVTAQSGPGHRGDFDVLGLENRIWGNPGLARCDQNCRK